MRIPQKGFLQCADLNVTALGNIMAVGNVYKCTFLYMYQPLLDLFKNYTMHKVQHITKIFMVFALLAVFGALVCTMHTLRYLDCKTELIMLGNLSLAT